jgi:lipopolysaccharide transport system permease protein
MTSSLAEISMVERGVPQEHTPPETWRVIEPTKGWAALRIGALWRYRELLYFLAWRDVKVRYKQTALGISWAILQPLLTMAVFSVVFGHFAGIPSDGVPYPLFVFAGLVPWTLFAYAMTQSSNSLVENQRLITKVYFPRLVIPVAAALAGLVDVAIASLVLLIVLAFYGMGPSLTLLTLPAFVLLATVTALGIGIWLSALNVQYRDVRYAVPFLSQIWFYVTPIAYSATLVTGRLHAVFALNPMAGAVEGFRWATLGRTSLDISALAISSVIGLVTLVSGLIYFHRMERHFADVV